MLIKKTCLYMIALLLPIAVFAATKIPPNPYQKNPTKAFNYVQNIVIKQHTADKWAEYLLGSYYEKGYGTSKDLIKAYVWYKMSADDKYEPAIAALAKLKKSLSASQISQGEAAAKKANTELVNGFMNDMKHMNN